MRSLGAWTGRCARALADLWRRIASRATITVLVAATLLGAASAQLDVDPAGGPLTLAEEVAAAFAAWQEASPDDLVEPTASFGFAPDLVGPDTASLTLRWEDGRTDVALSPARYRTGPVLLHEVGLLLGLPEVGEGVMAPAFASDAPDEPTPEDLALLRDQFTYPPADLTRDGTVDFYDLAAFGAAFGSVGINLRADLNGDGRVDEADLAELQEAYAFAPPSSTPPESTNLEPPEDPSEPAVDEDDAPEADDVDSDEGLDVEPEDGAPDEVPAAPGEDGEEDGDDAP